jgi:hypothetical protein
VKENNLFFLENRINLPENKIKLVLFDAAKYLKDYSESIDSVNFDKEINPEKYLSVTKELDYSNISPGLYTGFVKKNNRERYVSANNEQDSRRLIGFNTQVRVSLIEYNKEYNTNPKEYLAKLTKIPEDIESVSDVFSYHINVGHGNCTIIYNKGKIIVIDCSIFDITGPRWYTSNLDSCIKHIKKQFALSSFHIDFFLLTHPHYDHYSGVEYLIKNNFIDSSTVFYLNEHYSFQGILYTRVLNKIINMGCKIFEPIKNNSNSLFEIVHPSKIIVKKPFNAPSIPIKDKIVEPNPNNASFVSLFELAGKKFLFPGDLEMHGWDKIFPCDICTSNINYFAISHHGSITGFERTVCGKNKQINDISACLSKDVYAVLMGRDGAYSGIYCPKVISSFKNLYYTEKDNNGDEKEFLEINLSTDEAIWYKEQV